MFHLLVWQMFWHIHLHICARGGRGSGDIHMHALGGGTQATFISPTRVELLSGTSMELNSTWSTASTWNDVSHWTRESVRCQPVELQLNQPSLGIQYYFYSIGWMQLNLQVHSLPLINNQWIKSCGVNAKSSVIAAKEDKHVMYAHLCNTADNK